MLQIYQYCFAAKIIKLSKKTKRQIHFTLNHVNFTFLFIQATRLTSRNALDACHKKYKQSRFKII